MVRSKHLAPLLTSMVASGLNYYLELTQLRSVGSGVGCEALAAQT